MAPTSPLVELRLHYHGMDNFDSVNEYLNNCAESIRFPQLLMGYVTTPAIISYINCKLWQRTKKKTIIVSFITGIMEFLVLI